MGLEGKGQLINVVAGGHYYWNSLQTSSPQLNSVHIIARYVKNVMYNLHSSPSHLACSLSPFLLGFSVAGAPVVFGGSL